MLPPRPVSSHTSLSIIIMSLPNEVVLLQEVFLELHLHVEMAYYMPEKTDLEVRIERKSLDSSFFFKLSDKCV